MSVPPVPFAPGRLPGLGHAPALLRDPLGFLGSLSRTGEVVRIGLGPRTVHVVTSPALVHALLTPLARTCPRGAVQQTLRDAFGDGLLMSEGTAHRDRRRSLQPAFTAERVAGYVPLVERLARDRIGAWQPGRTVDVAREMNHLALEIVTGALFGARLRPAHTGAFHRALPELVKGQIIQSLWPHPALARLPLPVNRRFAAAVRVLNRVVDQAVRTPSDDEAGPLLALLRTVTDPATGRPLDEHAVRSEAIAMFGAGTETVSTTLSWLCQELLDHPEVHRELLAEIDQQLRPGEELSIEAIERLPYLRRVLREVLRLHAPNAFLMRTAAEQVRLGPYTVPAGAELLYSLTALHRDPARHTDPLLFDPDRPLSTERHAFLPFGAGKHRCIGEAFAWMELAVVAVTLLRTWRLRPVAGARAREVVWTTVQAQGVRLKPERLTARLLPAPASAPAAENPAPQKLGAARPAAEEPSAEAPALERPVRRGAPAGRR
ncbi:cytochrome P450 [Kitasatospora sp. NPDC004289]